MLTLFSLLLWRNALLIQGTETSKIEAEYRATKEAVRANSEFKAVVDPIITINEEFQIESWNPAAEKIFGYDPEEVIGKNVNLLMPEPFCGYHDA